MRFLVLFPLALATAHSAEWKVVDDSRAQTPSSPLVIERKIISRAGDSGLFSSSRKIDLVWFNARTHTFRVIDNGTTPETRFPDLATAILENGCLAGCNGGFFLKDYAPSGLMIDAGSSTGTFGTGGLLSGVLLSSGNRNPYLLRRSQYSGSKYKPSDLIQAGPFLVDRGVTVRGLSPENSRRRTFAIQATDKWFAIGLSDAFTLAELGEVLALTSFSPSRPIQRALNLDGGTSSGLFVPGGNGESPLIHVEPFKTVRNFVGIVPR